MEHGEEIVFEREADESPDHTAGDVIFKLQELPHSQFVRSGSDLYMNFTISMVDALLGFSKIFEHLDGAQIKIERNGVTQPGIVTFFINAIRLPRKDSETRNAP
jgi:DnaJ-class molecular chaperone